MIGFLLAFASRPSVPPRPGGSTSPASRQLRVPASLVGLLRLAATASRASAERQPAHPSSGATDESRSSRAQQLVRREDDYDDDHDDVAVPFHVPSAPRRASPRELVRHEVDVAYDAGEEDEHAQKQEFLETMTSSADGDGEDKISHGASRVESDAAFPSAHQYYNAGINLQDQDLQDHDHHQEQLDEAMVEQDEARSSHSITTDSTSATESKSSAVNSCAADERDTNIPANRTCGASGGVRNFCEREGWTGGFVLDNVVDFGTPTPGPAAKDCLYQGSFKRNFPWSEGNVPQSGTEKRATCRTLCSRALHCTHFAYAGYNLTETTFHVECLLFKGCPQAVLLPGDELGVDGNVFPQYQDGWSRPQLQYQPTVWRCVAAEPEPASATPVDGDQPGPTPANATPVDGDQPGPTPGSATPGGGDQPDPTSSAKTASSATSSTTTTSAVVQEGSVSAIVAVVIAGGVIAAGAVLSYIELNQNNPGNVAY